MIFAFIRGRLQCCFEGGSQLVLDERRARPWVWKCLLTFVERCCYGTDCTCFVKLGGGKACVDESFFHFIARASVGSWHRRIWLVLIINIGRLMKTTVGCCGDVDLVWCLRGDETIQEVGGGDILGPEMSWGSPVTRALGRFGRSFQSLADGGRNQGNHVFDDGCDQC